MKALLIHRETCEDLLDCTNEQLGSIFRALIKLILFSDMSAIAEGIPSAMWNMIKRRSIDYANKYDEQCSRRAEKAKNAAFKMHSKHHGK